MEQPVGVPRCPVVVGAVDDCDTRGDGSSATSSSREAICSVSVHRATVPARRGARSTSLSCSIAEVEVGIVDGRSAGAKSQTSGRARPWPEHLARAASRTPRRSAQPWGRRRRWPAHKTMYGGLRRRPGPTTGRESLSEPRAPRRAARSWYSARCASWATTFAPDRRTPAGCRRTCCHAKPGVMDVEDVAVGHDGRERNDVRRPNALPKM